MPDSQEVLETVDIYCQLIFKVKGHIDQNQAALLGTIPLQCSEELAAFQTPNSHDATQ